jgi:hypothetical protein
MTETLVAADRPAAAGDAVGAFVGADPAVGVQDHLVDAVDGRPGDGVGVDRGVGTRERPPVPAMTVQGAWSSTSPMVCMGLRRS